jgi:hypothetical protein
MLRGRSRQRRADRRKHDEKALAPVAGRTGTKMNNSKIAAETWVVIHAPNRLPSPYAAYRYKDGHTYGYALDGMTCELVRQQLPIGGVRRARKESDHPDIFEFWDY